MLNPMHNHFGVYEQPDLFVNSFVFIYSDFFYLWNRIYLLSSSYFFIRTLSYVLDSNLRCCSSRSLRCFRLYSRCIISSIFINTIKQH